ncbi:MAG: sigma-70 family RNA polymerase sigma factor [Acidobacteria bacterium]|nr:sigma-70 family RNA polymerase sigma factor [Acidobacteriota bacterium]
MSSTQAVEITGLLQSWQAGDDQALPRLVSRLHDELHRLAAACERRERWHSTLSATELLSEAYLRLARQPMPEWENRAQFFAVAARLMRQILVDRARMRRALKRPRLEPGLPATTAAPVSAPIEFLDLHRALEAFEREDDHAAHLVELRYFAGLTQQEIAVVEGVSDREIRRVLRYAEAWLMEWLTARES